VVTAIVPSTHYIDAVDAVYLSESSPLYPLSACNYGSVERWSGLPLLYTKDQFLEFNKDSDTVWLVVPTQSTSAKIGNLEELLTNGESFTSPDGMFLIVQLSADDLQF
jgi:hypothetical protein